MKNSDTKFYLDQLRSNECLCGNNKKPKLAFCYSCFNSFPTELQVRLYNRIGYGFREAYEDAAKLIEEK